MSQRDSGYERKDRDLYETPDWVSESVAEFLECSGRVWEPACGSGKMLRALERSGKSVVGSDIEPLGDFARLDFLNEPVAPEGVDAIVTNPPYELAAEFCAHAIDLMQGRRGLVAMLLRTDFDHAASRRHLFADCPSFWSKAVLTRRIMWFDPAPGAKGKSPSFNHAWFLWNWRHQGPAELTYLFSKRRAL